MMTISWHTFGDPAFQQKRLDHLFEGRFGKPVTGVKDTGARTWVPPADIFETGDELLIEIELPGVDPSQVNIQVKDNILNLKGERKVEGAPKEYKCRRVERSHGAFNRAFALPPELEADKLQAQYKDGVLILRAPKREDSKPKNIEIKAA